MNDVNKVNDVNNVKMLNDVNIGIRSATPMQENLREQGTCI